MDNENQLEAVRPFLETRFFAYDLLRRTFLEEPSKEFLRFLREERLIESFPFRGEADKIWEGAEQVVSFLQEYEGQSEKKYNDLHWDYTRLFIGPYELPAPPWESAYLNKERLLFQEQTLQVRQVYLKYGFLPGHFRQEADDHLGLELDFMYQLSSQSLEALKIKKFTLLEEALHDQKAFLQDHLLRWVPAFSLNVIENAKLGFYQGMAKILDGYLALDLQALEELLDMDIFS